MGRIFKLKPFYCKKVWGYENWNLSTHKNGYCTIENTDSTLLDVLQKELPILIKIIKADETLSVQVHPNSEYARKNEDDNGKVECWYILEANENSELICGIKKGYDRESFKNLIENGNVEESLNKIPVKPGDMVYIPSGTVHAIQGGIKLIEVQQSSDITYRIYDWNRKRELHINKSLDVINYKCDNKCGKVDGFSKLETPYFTIEKLKISETYSDNVSSEFHTYTVIDGNGIIKCNKKIITLSKEETIYIEKGLNYTIEGNLELLKVYI